MENVATLPRSAPDDYDDALPVTASMLVPAALSDQRVHPRFAVTLAITMSGDNNFYCGLTENLSEGGIFIATHHVIPLGTRLRLEFSLPTSDRVLVAEGTVQWLRGYDAVECTGPELPSVASGVGVRFDTIDDEAADAVRAFVLRRRPEFYED